MLSGLPTKNGLLASQNMRQGSIQLHPQHIRPALARVAAFGYRSPPAQTPLEAARLGAASLEGSVSTGDERAAFDVSGPALKRSAKNLKGNAMSHASYELKAEARDRVGKGAAP